MKKCLLFLFVLAVIALIAAHSDRIQITSDQAGPATEPDSLENVLAEHRTQKVGGLDLNP